jgi:hypothetical protein
MFGYYKYTTGLSFAEERIGPLDAIVTTIFYLLALYLLVLPNTPENLFASIYSEPLIKTTHQHLLLLVGFDTLIYRKYYDTPPILVGHQGIIIVQGSFEVSNTCDKELNRLAQTFGTTAEYARLKGETNHNVLPNIGRSLPDQDFDATQDSKTIQVHPTDPNKTTSIAVNLDPA